MLHLTDDEIVFGVDRLHQTHMDRKSSDINYPLPDFGDFVHAKRWPYVEP